VPGLKVKKLNLKHVDLLRSQSTFSQSLHFKKPECARSRYFGKFKQVNLQVYEGDSGQRAASQDDDKTERVNDDCSNIVVGRKLSVPFDGSAFPKMNTLAVSNKIKDFRR